MSENTHQEFTIILPCYNEAHRLSLSLPNLFKWRKEFEKSHLCTVKVFLANDGCTDETLALAQKISQNEPHFSITGYNKNQGRGAVLQNAFLQVSASSLFALYMDSDLATDLKHVHNIWTLHTRHKEKLMVCGNRYFPGNKLKRPLLRKIWSWGWRKFVSTLFWRKLPDTQCGFKSLSFDLIQEVMGPLAIKGFVADVEMVLRATAVGARIHSLDIDWEEKKGSTIRWSTVFKMLLELKVLRFDVKI